MRAVATDLAGNTATTSTTFTIDRTSPAPTALTLINADGFVTPGTDEVRITFSEALSVSSVCSAWSGSGDQSLGGSGVVVTITDSGANGLAGMPIIFSAIVASHLAPIRAPQARGVLNQGELVPDVRRRPP